MAPPKPGTSAATGTIDERRDGDQRADRRAGRRPRRATRKRRHEAVKLNSALRKATPSAKPPTISAADAGWPSSSTSATSTAVRQHRRDRGTASRGAAMAPRHAGVVAAMLMASCAADRASLRRACLRAEAERLLQVVPLGARGFDRAAAHWRSIRPSSRHRGARPCGRAVRDSTNQSVAAQWPVLQ